MWGQGRITFCLNLQRGAHQCEESGAEGDGPISVQRHIHGNQPLIGRERLRRGEEGGGGGEGGGGRH